jgi:transposase
MNQLSEYERVTLLMIIGIGDKRRSFRDARDVFNGMFADRNPISVGTVKKTLDRFVTLHSIKNKVGSGRPKTATSLEKRQEIMEQIVETPKISTSQLALNHDVSITSIRRVLRKEKAHPYKVQLIHELTEDDPDKRMEFCEILQNQITNNPAMLRNILFSDEATFCLNGSVNRHNLRYWSTENPHWCEELHTQYPKKVNVWLGVIGNIKVGPFFIDGILTSQRYLELLQNEIIPHLRNIFNEVEWNNIWFQQDGAPPHYGAEVRTYLDRTFPQRWIGRRGSIEWPPRSPDLQILDFSIWGHLKSKVYVNRPQNLEDLRRKISEEVQNITEEHLENCLRAFMDRLGHCQAVQGLQFEHLL